MERYREPEEIGLDSERLRSANRVVQDGIEKGLFPGAVYIVGRSDGTIAPRCFGHTSLDRAHEVTPDTVYDLASITKPVATAASLLLLIERGKIHLGQSIARFFPGRTAERHEGITIRHLLTHTSGLPEWKDLSSENRTKDGVISAILDLTPEGEPGTVYAYSCLGYILLGAIIETVAGTGLDRFARENIFVPLGMEDTTFRPDGDAAHRIAATGDCPARTSTPVGNVHDANAWAMGGVSGNAGLFSTAPDLARFGTMILSDGARVLSPLSVRLMMKNLIDPAVGYHTAGWFLCPNELLPSGDLLSERTIGHTGFTGASAIIDRACDLFVILLTNRVCIPGDGMEFRSQRRLFHNTVAQSISECRTPRRVFCADDMF